MTANHVVLGTKKICQRCNQMSESSEQVCGSCMSTNFFEDIGKDLVTDSEIRSTISDDAKYIADRASENASKIVTHLWIILVVLPVVLCLLYTALK